MGGKTDVAKGRIKEAAGALTDNDRLRAEGRADQAVGRTKQAIKKIYYNDWDAGQPVVLSHGCPPNSDRLMPHKA